MFNAMAFGLVLLSQATADTLPGAPALERRFARVSAEYERLKAERARDPKLAVDTVTLSGFVVVVPRRIRSQVDPELPGLAAEWARLFRPVTAPPAVELAIEERPNGINRKALFVVARSGGVDAGVGRAGGEITDWLGRSGARVRLAVWEALAGILETASDRALHGWLLPPPIVRPDMIDGADLYHQVAMAGSATVRGCLGGNVAGCRRAFGFDPATPPTAGVQDRWNFFTPYTRGSLVAVALAAGGDGAWARLRADTAAPIEARLAAAARLPADQLFVRWREQVDRWRPRGILGEWAQRLASLGWVALGLAIAVGRGIRR